MERGKNYNYKEIFCIKEEENESYSRKSKKASVKDD